MKKVSRWAIALLCVAAYCLSQAQAQTPNAAHPEYQRVASSGLSEKFELGFSSLHFGARTSEGLRPFKYGLKSAGSHLRASSLSLSPLAASANLQVVGSGTLGRLTKWTGFTSSNSFIGDSTLFESKTGLVGIGTDTPTAKLTVAGTIQSLSGGFQFPDGTVQTTSAAGSLFTVSHDATLIGNGTAGSPLGVAVPLVLSGSLSGTDAIINAINTVGIGVLGQSTNNDGVVGESTGVIRAGVHGINNIPFLMFGFGIGVLGEAEFGVGVTGRSQNGTGVAGVTDDIQGIIAPNIGVLGAAMSGTGVRGDSVTGLAGFFNGNVNVSGDLAVTGVKNFKIDHPLDPENKYLYHAAIESAEVLNVYSGNVMTNEKGEATVTLPDWFETVNRDFRYQLTVVGTFAQAIVADEVRSNHFKIKTTAPGVKVSWQVTGVRSDAAMKKHPFKVEQDKPERERGSYLNPEAFDQPAERGVEWVRNPELMRQLKARREPMKQNK